MCYFYYCARKGEMLYDVQWPEEVVKIYETDGAMYISRNKITDDERKQKCAEEFSVIRRVLEGFPEVKAAALVALLFGTADRASATCRLFLDNLFIHNEIPMLGNPKLIFEKVFRVLSTMQWDPVVFITAETTPGGTTPLTVFYPFGMDGDAAYVFLEIKSRKTRDGVSTALPYDWRVPVVLGDMMPYFVSTNERPDRNIVLKNFPEPRLASILFDAVRVPVTFMFANEVVLVDSLTPNRVKMSAFVSAAMHAGCSRDFMALRLFEVQNFNLEKSEFRREVNERFDYIRKNVRPWTTEKQTQNSSGLLKETQQ